MTSLLPSPAPPRMRPAQHSSKRPDTGEAPEIDQRRSVHAAWTFTLGSIVFILLVLDTIVVLTALETYTDSPNALEALLIGLLLVSAGTHVRFSWFLRVGRGGGLPRTAWTVALIAPAAGAWVLGLVSDGGALLAAVPLWIAISLCACLVPKRMRWMLLAAGLSMVVVHPVLASSGGGHPYGSTIMPDRWLLMFYVVLLPAVLLSSLWWWEIIVTLDKHRSLAAELAVARERLRFAADLHDVQGHHLQVIALKSELAERMLDVDPESARTHMHETRLIARQALDETRSLVSGYREIALHNELVNAREVLSAAGAECDLDLGPLPAGVDVRRAFAMAVREATTNILRHSTATWASISLRTSDDRCTLVIRNNGLSADTYVSTVAGTGLAGLADRFAVLGGRLDTSVDTAGDRFEVRAEAPTGAGAAA